MGKINKVCYQWYYSLWGNHPYISLTIRPSFRLLFTIVHLFIRLFILFFTFICSFIHWLIHPSILQFIQPSTHIFFFSRKTPVKQQYVVTQSGIPYGVSTYQVTEDNSDFAYRDRVHQSSVITSLAPWAFPEEHHNEVNFCITLTRNHAYHLLIGRV